MLAVMLTESGKGIPAQMDRVQISPPPTGFCSAARIRLSEGVCCPCHWRHRCLWWDAEAKE